MVPLPLGGGVIGEVASLVMVVTIARIIAARMIAAPTPTGAGAAGTALVPAPCGTADTAATVIVAGGVVVIVATVVRITVVMVILMSSVYIATCPAPFR